MYKYGFKKTSEIIIFLIRAAIVQIPHFIFCGVAAAIAPI